MNKNYYRTLFGNRVAVIGASSKRERYSNKAVRALLEAGYEVYPVHPAQENIEGLKAYATISDIDGNIDFVSIYLNPNITLENKIVEQLKEKNVKGVILNPGAQSDELVEKLKSYKIKVLQECTIVDGLGRNISEF